MTDGLHTGDLGFLDESGYLRLTGRANRFAKVHGVRVSLDEIESLLRLDRRVAAIAPGDDRVLVLVEDGEDLECDALRHQLAEALRVSSLSIRIRAVPSIPTKTNGKTDYARLAEIV